MGRVSGIIPGAGPGAEQYNPNQIMAHQLEAMKREEMCKKNHVAYFGIPGSKYWTGEIKQRVERFKELDDNDVNYKSYWNSHKPPTVPLTGWERLMLQKEPGYDPRVRREDRKSASCLNVNGEEAKRAVPLLSNTNIGHRSHLYQGGYKLELKVPPKRDYLIRAKVPHSFQSHRRGHNVTHPEQATLYDQCFYTPCVQRQYNQ